MNWHESWTSRPICNIGLLWNGKSRWISHWRASWSISTTSWFEWKLWSSLTSWLQLLLELLLLVLLTVLAVRIVGSRYKRLECLD